MLQDKPLQDRIVKISNGNPGALSVCKVISATTPITLEPLLQQLEKHNITGSDIWNIYKNKCNEKLTSFVTYPFETYVSQL